jgi:hypothetical protein
LLKGDHSLLGGIELDEDDLADESTRVEEDVEGLASELFVAASTGQVAVHHFQQLQFETAD